MCLKVGAFCCGKNWQLRWCRGHLGIWWQAKTWTGESLNREEGRTAQFCHPCTTCPPSPIKTDFMLWDWMSSRNTPVTELKVQTELSLCNQKNREAVKKATHCYCWFDRSYQLRSAINQQLRKGTIQAQLRELSKSLCASPGVGSFDWVSCSLQSSHWQMPTKLM